MVRLMVVSIVLLIVVVLCGCSELPKTQDVEFGYLCDQFSCELQTDKRCREYCRDRGARWE